MRLGSAGSVHELIDALPWPARWNMREFLDAVGRQRGKPIKLYRAELTSLPCGLLVRTQAADRIVVAACTTSAHARHIAMHELGHLLCEHPDSGERGVLGQTLFAPRWEKEAERFADLADERVDAIQSSADVARLPWTAQQLHAAFGPGERRRCA